MKFELRKINDKAMFDSFVEKHAYVHYMKTSMWGEYKSATENTKYELLGFYENDNLVGTAMVLKGKWLNHSYLYIPWDHVSIILIKHIENKYLLF